MVSMGTFLLQKTLTASNAFNTVTSWRSMTSRDKFYSSITCTPFYRSVCFLSQVRDGLYAIISVEESDKEQHSLFSRKIVIHFTSEENTCPICLPSVSEKPINSEMTCIMTGLLL